MDLLHEVVVDDPDFSCHTSISVVGYSPNQRILTADFESSQVGFPFKILVYTQLREQDSLRLFADIVVCQVDRAQGLTLGDRVFQDEHVVAKVHVLQIQDDHLPVTIGVTRVLIQELADIVQKLYCIALLPSSLFTLDLSIEHVSAQVEPSERATVVVSKHDRDEA